MKETDVLNKCDAATNNLDTLNAPNKPDSLIKPDAPDALNKLDSPNKPDALILLLSLLSI